MADICPVCNKSISFWDEQHPQGIKVHYKCEGEFHRNPEKYGGKAIKKTEAQIKAEKEHQQEQEEKAQHQQEQEEKSIYKSVYIKGGVDVKSFDMPFGDMVGFIFKWAMASIPTAIFLAILFLIFTAIFA